MTILFETFSIENKSKKTLNISFRNCYGFKESFDVSPNQTAIGADRDSIEMVEIKPSDEDAIYIYDARGIFYTYAFIRSDGVLCIYYKDKKNEYKEVHPTKVDSNYNLKDLRNYYNDCVDEMIQKHKIQSASSYFINHKKSML